MAIRVELYGHDDDLVDTYEYDSRKELLEQLSIQEMHDALPLDDGDLEGLTPEEKQARIMKELEGL